MIGGDPNFQYHFSADASKVGIGGVAFQLAGTEDRQWVSFENSFGAFQDHPGSTYVYTYTLILEAQCCKIGD